jgi:hypothetical protein
VGSVDRPTLVELIEAQKAKLSPEALGLWEELDSSLYMSPEEGTFLKRHEVYLIDRMDRLPEKDRHIQDVLTERRAGLYESDLSERRGAPGRAVAAAQGQVRDRRLAHQEPRRAGPGEPDDRGGADGPNRGPGLGAAEGGVIPIRPSAWNRISRKLA